jgi:hypothetical protein
LIALVLKGLPDKFHLFLIVQNLVSDKLVFKKLKKPLLKCDSTRMPRNNVDTGGAWDLPK